MMILGITGGTGSGKTTLLGCVAARGGCVIDCDEVYHALLQSSAELLSEVEARFPGVVENGELNRRKLGKLVFGNPEALRALSRITHRYVCAEVDDRLKQARQGGCLLAAVDAIALFESGLSGLCDRTIAVIAPREARIRRLMLREGICRDYAELRIGAQEPDEVFSGRCDAVLVNDCETAQAFAARCDGLLDQILGGTEHERRNL